MDQFFCPGNKKKERGEDWLEEKYGGKREQGKELQWVEEEMGQGKKIIRQKLECKEIGRQMERNWWLNSPSIDQLIHSHQDVISMEIEQVTEGQKNDARKSNI